MMYFFCNFEVVLKKNNLTILNNLIYNFYKYNSNQINLNFMHNKDNNNKDSKNSNKNPFGPFGEFKRNNPPRNPNTNFMRVMMWILLGVMIFSFYSLFEESNKQEWEISYTEYRRFLEQDLIEKATIKKSSVNDYEFHGVLKQQVEMNLEGGSREVSRFYTKIAFIDANIEAEWASHGITWTYEDGNDTFWGPILSLLPWVLMIGAYIFFIRLIQRGGGAGGGSGGKGIFNFGKSKAKLLDESTNKITFSDVAGADEAKFELAEIIDFLKAPQKFQKLGGKIPKGVLLLGPPGTGKTLLARAVAGEAKVPFFTISGADFVEMFVGVGASRVRDLFENAKKNAPCIVFIDEIDAVGRQRGAGLGGGHDEREQTLNQLLVEMDGFEQNSGVIVIAATNRPDVLDSALLRPGRFDRQIVVDRPDVRGREEIFKVHCRKIPLDKDVDLKTLAKGTPGLSGADIANIVNEAALLAARHNAEKVSMYDFENAKDKVLMGVERKSLVISEKEKEMTAYHEMGHALVGKLLPAADPVYKVTIIPRGRALGATSYLPKEDLRTHTKEYILANITMMLAGRAAEKIVFNNQTTGASNDLERATMLARKMVCEWGMSDVVGPVTYSEQSEEVFLGRDFSRRQQHSEKIAQIIDEEIRTILHNASDHAEQLLTDNIDMLHKTSKILIERETLDGEELDMILRGEELPPITKSQLNTLRSLKFQHTNASEEENNDKTIKEEI